MVFKFFYQKNDGFTSFSIIQEAHNNASQAITFIIISVHCLNQFGFAQEVVIRTHATINSKNDTTNIIETNIFQNIHIKIGKAFSHSHRTSVLASMSSFSFSLQEEVALPNVSLSHIRIQSHIKGNIVLSFIQHLQFFIYSQFGFAHVWACAKDILNDKKL